MGHDNGDGAEARTLWAESEQPVALNQIGQPEALSELPGEAARAPYSPGERAASGARQVVSAADVGEETMLRPTVQPPARGWRRAVFRLSAGTVRVGPAAGELRQRELVARVKTPIRGCRKVAFISRKGGVGKTSTCLLAGHTFAVYRGDRVVAFDGNPDAGTLGHRVKRETSATVTSLLADAERVERYADIRAYTSQAPSRLEVIAADDNPQLTHGLAEKEFARAVALLERHYNLVCLDTGTGVLDSATRGILDASDQVVVVSATSLDGARAASLTLDWLEENGHRDLAEGAVAVLNAVRPARGLVDLDRVEQHFASRCRACVRIPWDPHLEAGAEAVVEELRPATRQAYLELAAAIAAAFTESSRRRS